MNRSDDDTRIRLVYDTDKNYFACALIEKTPFHETSFFDTHVREGHRIVPLREASEATFFRFEIFFRHFLIFCFRDFQVFHHFHQPIVDLLHDAIGQIEKRNFDGIKQAIIRLVNGIVAFFNERDIAYNEVDMTTLDEYASIHGETIDAILDPKAIVIPEWFNANAHRQY